MKVLLDENVPFDLRRLLVGHDVATVAFMRWKGLRNGVLMTRAATEGFEVLVTRDGNIPAQHNRATLPLALVILVAKSNDMEDIEPLVPALLSVLTSLKPRDIVYVP